MKKIALHAVITVFALGSMNAQELPYNKWSLDINAGTNKAVEPFTPGYYSDNFNFFHVDGGARYMFNNKFGVKADFGFDALKNAEKSKPFKTNHYRVSFQGVANIGRFLNFEDWTSVLNLQGHFGLGYNWITNKDHYPGGKDGMGHVISGLTGQVKLTKWLALNADVSMIKTLKQQRNFDGPVGDLERRGFDGTVFNTTLGLSFYLGGKDNHADWYSDSVFGKISDLENRVTDIDNKLLDDDNDGVPNYLDLEPDTPANTLVDNRGRSIDKNNNGIPDNYEEYLNEKYGHLTNNVVSEEDGRLIEKLINEGYIAVYFDFNKATPKHNEGINFVINYLNSNEFSSVEVHGYADVLGSDNYNEKLSLKRAENVKAILEKFGVDSSKIIAKGEGKDTNFSKEVNNRKVARRVVFKVAK